MKFRIPMSRADRAHNRRAEAIFASRSPAQSLLFAVADEPEDGAGFAWAANESVDAGLKGHDQHRYYGIGVIAELLNGGFIVIGEQTVNGFAPWPTGAGDSLLRLERVWRENGNASWAAEGWMVATKEGLAEVERILAHEDWSWRTDSPPRGTFHLGRSRRIYVTGRRGDR